MRYLYIIAGFCGGLWTIAAYQNATFADLLPLSVGIGICYGVAFSMEERLRRAAGGHRRV